MPPPSDAQAGFSQLSTQMRLHLDRIAPGAASYSFHDITDPGKLDAVFTCYRATASRVECSMRTPFIAPMRIRDVRERLDEFVPIHRAAFTRYAETFSQQEDGPIEMVLPAYGLGADGFLLLDGNHRATAAAMAGRPFRVTLAVLHGPIDRRILVDLKFWDGGMRRFVRRAQAVLARQ